MGRSGRTTDDAAFADLDEMLALAKLPNVAVKLSGAPSYSSATYPWRNIHPYIQRIFDAFGPQRSFWGTDITRMPCSYRECVTMFTEELPWLSGHDLNQVMGRAPVRVGRVAYPVLYSPKSLLTPPYNLLSAGIFVLPLTSPATVMAG